MTAPAPPGWYADPDRTPGRQRWWSGHDWSDVTQGGPGPPPVLAPDILAGRSAPIRSRRWLVLVLVLLVVAAGSAWVTLRQTAGPMTTGQASVATGPAEPYPPGTPRIIDRDAGISYPFLGEGWKEWDLSMAHDEVQGVHGQYIVTQDTVPDGGEFIAECTSGLLSTGFGTDDPQGFPGTVAAAADSFRSHYYPAPNTRRDLVGRAFDIDGHAAYELSFDLSWDLPGYDSTGERVALVLIDTGHDTPALLYLSFPNTHGELYGAMARVIASVEVV